MTNLGLLAVLGLGATGLYLFAQSKEKKAEEKQSPELKRQPGQPSLPPECPGFPVDELSPVPHYEYLLEHPACIAAFPPEALHDLSEALYNMGAGEAGLIVEEWYHQSTVDETRD